MLLSKEVYGHQVVSFRPPTFKALIFKAVRPAFAREHFKTGAEEPRRYSFDRLAPSWNTILSPKLTVSTSGFGRSTRCSGGAFSSTIRQHPGRSSVVLRSASTGRTSISIVFAFARKTTPCHAGGRPRTTDLRAVLNAIFYLLRTGCQWRLLPREFPRPGTVYHYFRAWKDAGRLDRTATGAS